MISDRALVETDSVGEGCEIAPFAVVRRGAVLGSNVRIHPGVVVEAGVEIGDGTEIFPGTYLGKEPKGAGATARRAEFEPVVRIGAECAIGPNAVVFYDVEVGRNTLLGDGVSLREKVRIGHHCLLGRYVTVNYATRIGDHTRIMDLTHITGNCEIGSNVFVSVLVSTTNDNVVVGRAFDAERIVGPRIEDDATVGAGACLLPGVVIGRGAMVGANAVVTRDVAPFDVVMGIPARFTRSLRSIPG